MFPTLDVVAIRGEGYVYFDGDDRFDKVESIYCHPTSTTTETLLKLAVQNIRSVYDFEMQIHKRLGDLKWNRKQH